MNFENEDLLNAVREYANGSLIEQSQETLERDELSTKTIRDLAELGLLGALIPKEFGGSALDYVSFGKAYNLIARKCNAARTLLTVHSSIVATCIDRFGTESQKSNYLPQMAKGDLIGAFALSEPRRGSSIANLETRYRRDGDSFIISGTKKWISFGAVANFFLVVAQEEQGKSSVFLVDRDDLGVSAAPLNGLTVGHGTSLAIIEFKDVIVGKDSLLGSEGSGLTFIVPQALDLGRYTVAWAAVGIAEAANTEMLEHAKTRIVNNKSVSEYQLTRKKIAYANVNIEAARALCLEAGNLRNQSIYQSEFKTLQAKYFSTTIAEEVANMSLQVLGAVGFSPSKRTGRLLNEAKALSIIEGTSEVHVELISQQVLKQFKLPSPSTKKGSRL